jgi:hypothetical protein
LEKLSDILEINTEDDLLDFIDKYPDFHVVLDNDCFTIYPSPMPDSPWDDVWEMWHDSAQSVDIVPKRFLELLIEYLGGTVENC